MRSYGVIPTTGVFVCWRGPAFRRHGSFWLVSKSSAMDTRRSDLSAMCYGVQNGGLRRRLRCFIGQGAGILSAVVGSWLAGRSNPEISD